MPATTAGSHFWGARCLAASCVALGAWKVGGERTGSRLDNDWSAVFGPLPIAILMVVAWGLDALLEVVVVVIASTVWWWCRVPFGSSETRDVAILTAEPAPHARLLERIRDAARSRQLGYVLDQFCDANSSDEVQQMSRAQQEEYFLTVATCAIRLGRSRCVASVITEMRRAGVMGNRGFFESTMRLLAKQGLYSESLEVYQEMICEGIVPSRDACNGMVSFLVEAGDLGKVVELLRTSPPERFRPFIRAYMKVLLALAADKTTESAVFCAEVFWDMRKRKIRADITVVNIVLGALADARELETVSQVMSSAHSDGILNIVGCNSVLRGLVRSGQAHRAWALLEEMEASGLVPTKSTFICFLHDGSDVAEEAFARLGVLQRRKEG